MNPAPRRPVLRSLEALRGIAALGVVIHHACGMASLPWNYGQTFLGNASLAGQLGVDVFFVLSGFLMAWTNPREGCRGEEIRKYALRRFCRIYPFYWVVCALYFPALYLLRKASGMQTFGWGEAAGSVLLLPWERDPLLGVAWTLRFEVMFYLLFIPFLAKRRLGWALWIVLGLLAIGSAWSGMVLRSPWLQQMLSLRSLEFLAGVGVAGLVERGWFHRGARPVLAGGLLLLVVGGWLEVRHGAAMGPWRWLLHGSAAALVVAGLAGWERQGLAVPGWLGLLGSCSYGVYLVHMPVQEWLFMHAGHWPGRAAEWALPVTVVVGLFSLAAGVVASLLVEKPLLRWCRRITEGRS
jgi:exopolysaccharide production protein ExoZ